MADDLGFNDLAINNQNPNIHTPNNQLAREGMRFTRHYAHAVCSPARAALLTGIFPERLGYLPNGRGISPDVVTLPEKLREEGYTTYHIGKWHLGDTHRFAWPDHQGFDHWFGFLNQWRLAGKKVNGEIVPVRPRYVNPWLEGDSDPGQYYSGHLENILTDRAIETLSALNTGQAPWFLNLWYYAPHTPVQPEASAAMNYPDTDAGRYRALVNQLDTNIGRVIAHLESMGVAHNTIVVLVSDNGGTSAQIDSNAPFPGKKATLTEGGLRTPLIIRWPEAVLNQRVYTETISIQDIYPTLMDYMNITVPPGLDGASYYQSMWGQEAAPQKRLYWELGNLSYAALSADSRWRLQQPAAHWGISAPLRLFDFDADPTASNPVDPAPTARLAAMLSDYEAWYRDVHTVDTVYTPKSDGSGALTGMDFQRAPGFDGFTFGMGVPGGLQGELAHQEGIWRLHRAGDTVTASFGDITLTGDMKARQACHSVVITGNFQRKLSAANRKSSMALTLHLDAVQVDSAMVDGELETSDITAQTTVGNPLARSGNLPITPPVILNVELGEDTPWTLEDFSQGLCGPGAQ